MCDGTGSGHSHPHVHPGEPEWITNLRQPMPLGRKLWLLFRNNFIKVRKLQDCCGNYGEPGC